MNYKLLILCIGMTLYFQLHAYWLNMQVHVYFCQLCLISGTLLIVHFKNFVVEG